MPGIHHFIAIDIRRVTSRVIILIKSIKGIVLHSHGSPGISDEEVVFGKHYTYQIPHRQGILI